MQARLFSKYFLLSSLVLLTGYAIYLLRDFMIAIIFSFVFAYLFGGMYDKLRKKVNKEWVAAALVILIIGLAIIIPVLWLMYSFVTEAQSFLTYLSASSPETANDFALFIERNFGVTFRGSDMQSILSLLGSNIIPALQRYLPSILSMFSNLGIQIFICGFLLFYLLIKKEAVIKTTIRYLPLTNAHSRLVLKEAGRTAKALVAGQGMIALIQGIAGAIGYLIFGIPGAFMWGFMMAIGSFIPFVGTALVWVPTGIVLLLQGDIISGLGILTWGAMIVGNIDNLVRPKLVSMLGEIHPVVVLLGVFIGVAEFNILGIIIGPLLLQMLLLLYKLFKEEYIVS